MNVTEEHEVWKCSSYHLAIRKIVKVFFSLAQRKYKNANTILLVIKFGISHDNAPNSINLRVIGNAK